jgi:threonine dehydratase
MTRRITIDDVLAARERIKGTVLRTPLVELRVDAPRQIFLKLENLQPINAFKLRGATNAVAMLSDEERRRGVWTISAGNAGQGVAYAARAAGITCTVLVIETAPETKIQRMRKLGATLVKAPFDACWNAMEQRAYPGMDGVFIHPFDDDHFAAGNGTLALEIVEDLPSVRTVITAVGGGGLLTGVATAIRALCPQARILGAEPETAAPLELSLRKNSPQIFEHWQATFVDGAGGKSIFPNMWERLRGLVDASIVVSLDEVRNAMRLMAEHARVIAEGAGALPVAAALRDEAGDGPVVCVVSGGNIDLAKFCELVTRESDRKKNSPSS